MQNFVYKDDYKKFADDLVNAIKKEGDDNPITTAIRMINFANNMRKDKIDLFDKAVDYLSELE